MAIEPLSRYRVTWRRVGEFDTFGHVVVAAGREEARRLSAAEVQRSLGPNSSLWELELVTALETIRPGLLSSLRSLFGRWLRPAPDVPKGANQPKLKAHPSGAESSLPGTRRSRESDSP